MPKVKARDIVSDPITSEPIDPAAPESMSDPQPEEKNEPSWRDQRSAERERHRAARQAWRDQRRLSWQHSNWGAILIIGLGVLFLLNNLGYLSLTTWRTLWQFWPVLLIILGLELAFGRTRAGQWAVSVVTVVLIVGVIGWILLSTNPAAWHWTQTQLHLSPHWWQGRY